MTEQCPLCQGRGTVILTGRCGSDWVEVTCECQPGPFEPGPEFDEAQHLCQTCGGLKVRPAGDWICRNCEP